VIISKEFSLFVRRRLLKMHYESGVGHIGGNLSCIDILLILFHEIINKDSDKFILSKGHSAGALYITLWSTGVISEKEICTFHKDNTLLPGHPPVSVFEEIPFATGSLGHGLSLAAGLSKYKQLTNTKGSIFCLTSDGEWQEGSTWEAFLFITKHLLNITVIIDNNSLQGFGRIDEISSMNNFEQKLSAFNCDIISIDGHDNNQIRSALSKYSNKTKVIVAHTIKGKGVPFMENKLDSHYLPLDDQTYKEAIYYLNKL